MLFLLVLLAWIAAIGYVPYHFRKTQAMALYLAGAKAIYWSILTATEHPPSEFHEGADPDEQPCCAGIITAVISLVILAILLLVVIAYTLYLAW